MATVPYMPLYVAEYMADTSHLTALEDGVYMRLIMIYWQRQAPLPDDDVKLHRIARVTPDEWAAMRETIAEFFTAEEGLWRHKRIDAELAKLQEKSQKASAAGRQSANKRSTPVERPLNERSASVEQTPNHVGIGLREGKKPTTPPVVPPRGDGTQDFDRFWQAYPRRPQNPRKPAEKLFAAAVKKGAKPDDLIAAAERYAAEMAAAGKLNTEFVCQAQTWLRQDRWKDTHGPPAKPQPTVSVDAFEARMRRMDQQERQQRQREAADADEERVSAADLASLIPDMRGMHEQAG